MGKIIKISDVREEILALESRVDDLEINSDYSDILEEMKMFDDRLYALEKAIDGLHEDIMGGVVELMQTMKKV